MGSVFALSACSAGPADPDTSELAGASEEVDTNHHAVSPLPVGTKLTATTNVNLRTGPSTSNSILHVVPNGASVTLVESSPDNGFYNVKHNGTIGWSYAIYYQAAPGGGGAGGGAAGGGGGNVGNGAQDAAIQRAKSAMGFSYWWGHGRFRPEGPSGANAGSCSGSCPSCSHSGSYGGDCSGLVGKIWQVPSGNSDLTVDDHPYSTASFVNDSSQWSTVSRNQLQAADAMVYNSGGHGHIFLYSSGDGWGSMYAYECKGCAAGCVHDLRTATSSYHAIRRAGW